MLKKLMLMAVSAAALLAFAVPAAQAEGPLITDAFEEAATEINAVSTNTTTTTSNGTLACATVTLSGALSTNDNTTAEGSGTGTAEGTVGGPHTGHCAVFGIVPVHILDITISRIHLESHASGTTGTADFTYTYVITTPEGPIHCTFEGNGVGVTRTGADEINVNGKLVRSSASPEACAPEGTLNGDFKVSDQNGEPAVIH